MSSYERTAFPKIFLSNERKKRSRRKQDDQSASGKWRLKLVILNSNRTIGNQI